MGFFKSTIGLLTIITLSSQTLAEQFQLYPRFANGTGHHNTTTITRTGTTTLTETISGHTMTVTFKETTVSSTITTTVTTGGITHTKVIPPGSPIWTPIGPTPVFPKPTPPPAPSPYQTSPLPAVPANPDCPKTVISNCVVPCSIQGYNGTSCAPMECTPSTACQGARGTTSTQLATPASIDSGKGRAPPPYPTNTNGTVQLLAMRSPLKHISPENSEHEKRAADSSNPYQLLQKRQPAALPEANPVADAKPPKPKETSVKAADTSLCKKLDEEIGNTGRTVCQLAYDKFDDEVLYTQATNFTYTVYNARVDSSWSALKGLYGYEGCLASFTCDAGGYALGMTGRQIKEAFNGMYGKGKKKAKVCGLGRLSNGCNVETEGCNYCDAGGKSTGDKGGREWKA